ncbi:cytochrome c3 family protein [Carboxydocella sp. ULO1]|uniref:cytochrome c3 family protein n=1 Tax=Carboxydocella sp. ULO1 TaxID=1926599 RepID=UPI0009AEFB83|nr:cytochrome c3 family protein [Carboxydocella sp. ULO1]GAW28154.1 hypothetical protein ULO1_07240 [Carboxydocella sp. ULO1]
MKKAMSPLRLTLLILMGLFLCWFKQGTAFGAEEQFAAKLAENRRFNEGCLRCHGAIGLKTKMDGKIVSLYVDEGEYLVSQHGTNRCTTCHRDITEYPHTGALTGEKMRVAIDNNCRDCHKDVTAVYSNSVHNGKVRCSACHGVHNIRKKEDALALVAKQQIPHTCTAAGCHSGRIKESYEESFHGKAVLLGSQKAASCVDCHGSHEIKGPGMAASPVSKTNTPKTCAKCHFKPEVNFAAGKEHFLLEKEGEGAPMYYTLKFFVWLTIIVVTLLIIHMQLELYRKLRNALASGEQQH